MVTDKVDFEAEDPEFSFIKNIHGKEEANKNERQLSEKFQNTKAVTRDENLACLDERRRNSGKRQAPIH